MGTRRIGYIGYMRHPTTVLHADDAVLRHDDIHALTGLLHIAAQDKTRGTIPGTAAVVAVERTQFRIQKCLDLRGFSGNKTILCRRELRRNRFPFIRYPHVLPIGRVGRNVSELYFITVVAFSVRAEVGRGSIVTIIEPCGKDCIVGRDEIFHFTTERNAVLGFAG